jgi:hypothetical protein
MSVGEQVLIANLVEEAMATDILLLEAGLVVMKYGEAIFREVHTLL